MSDNDMSSGSTKLIARFYSGIPQTRPMGRDETFYSNDKAKRLVGFAPGHSWREVLE